MLLVEELPETGLFRHSYHHVSRYISYEGHLFIENVINWIWVSKMQRKIAKMIFVSEIIESDDVAINFLY